MGATIPLRIDSELVNQARSAGALSDRPPTAQIEHWAKLGRVLDSVFTGASVAQVKQLSLVDDLDSILTLTQTPEGKAKARELIARLKGPVYAADPHDTNVIIEKLSDGTSRRGRFVNRQFVAISKGSSARKRKGAAKSVRPRSIIAKG